ncbi:MAG TPA: hypothetical protein VLU41_06605 [Ideonella sp.]|nr:hypothetical protein [Ideonella sp.]
MKARLFDVFGSRQRRRQCSGDSAHPTLWIALALAAAIAGAAAAAFWRNADDDPKLALAAQARGWLEAGAAPARAAPAGTRSEPSR